MKNYETAEEVFLSIVQKDPEVYQITVVQALLDLYIIQDKLNES